MTNVSAGVCRVASRCSLIFTSSACISKECGIHSDQFWKLLNEHHPSLRGIVRSEKTAAWLDVMADMRHPAAHNRMLFPTKIVQETEDSTRSDEEITEILRAEDPEFFEIASVEMRRSMLPTII